ncbi:hypothetical protein FIBSPDRAFT_838662 [Athelia psychrophila]|uniref:Helicase ATP-binding domain-containing protein n=1 Tax=Athelia psychrophila TaxID=1759441 RepID=A0A165Z8C9_9AGAM|nr:hypothetical protein FIBSPDRAFT_838662 [Fibularhizoctonia sp. CBS 109695]
MNNIPPAPERPHKFLFSTNEGHTLCKTILQDRIPYEPHDVQIDGLCKLLDNIDLFAILATGSGKTSFLSMYMLVLLAIQANPCLCPTASFPRNPCMLAVCPTKYLEHQMAEVMEKLGLSALVINADTLQAAKRRGEDLWKKAETEPSLLFLAPEQLISPKFSTLIKADGEFAVRVCAIAVDEAHLLNTWGRSWRKVGFL